MSINISFRSIDRSRSGIRRRGGTMPMAELSLPLLALFLHVSNLASPNASAEIELNNSNYTNTWVDMIVPGGDDKDVRMKELHRVSRTYNSRSNFNGMFGVAWNSLAWMTGPVGAPVGEPPSGSSEIPKVALLITAGS